MLVLLKNKKINNLDKEEIEIFLNPIVAQYFSNLILIDNFIINFQEARSEVGQE